MINPLNRLAVWIVDVLTWPARRRKRRLWNQKGISLKPKEEHGDENFKERVEGSLPGNGRER
jgi:hypothetical protein